jgi:hypothetical protein
MIIFVLAHLVGVICHHRLGPNPFVERSDMYPDSEILFPPRCIEQMNDLRGPKWQSLVNRVLSLPHNHEEVLAFGLLLIDLGSCLTCDLDSYRASLGCCTCARRSVSGFKKDDDALLAEYGAMLEKVHVFVEDDKPLSAELLLGQEMDRVCDKRR